MRAPSSRFFLSLLLGFLMDHQSRKLFAKQTNSLCQLQHFLKSRQGHFQQLESISISSHSPRSQRNSGIGSSLLFSSFIPTAHGGVIQESCDNEIIVSQDWSHDIFNSCFCSSLYQFPGSHLVCKTGSFLFIFVLLPLIPQFSARLVAFIGLLVLCLYDRKTEGPPCPTSANIDFKSVLSQFI